MSTGKIFSDLCPNMSVKMVRLPNNELKQSAKEVELNAPASERRSSRFSLLNSSKSENMNQPTKKKSEEKGVAKSTNRVSNEIKTKYLKSNAKSAEKESSVRRSTRLSLNKNDDTSNVAKIDSVSSIKNLNNKKHKVQSTLDARKSNTKKVAIISKNNKNQTKKNNDKSTIESKQPRRTLNSSKIISSANRSITDEKTSGTKKVELTNKQKNHKIDNNDSSLNLHIKENVKTSKSQKSKTQELNKSINDDKVKRSPLGRFKKSLDTSNSSITSETDEKKKNPVGRPKKSLNNSLASDAEEIESHNVKNNDESSNIAQDLPDQSYVTEKAPSPRLRNKKLVDYRESSLNASKDPQIESSKPIENNTQAKMPVYKQKVGEETQEGSKKDLYEFEVSDAEEELNINKKKKQKKRAITKKAKVKKTNKATSIQTSINKYDDKVNKIMKIIMEKVESRKNNKESNKGLENLDEKTASCSKEQKSVSIDIEKSNDISKDLQLQSPLDAFDDLLENNNNVDKDKSNSDRIHILSNVVVHEPDDCDNDSDDDFDEEKLLKSPWRLLCEGVSRTPYFIKVKPSALPSVIQEMVLDHTIVESHPKFNAEETVTNVSINQPASPVQKSILEYVTVHKSNDIAQIDENISSLFDSHKYSPLKIRNENVMTPSKVTKRKLLQNNDKENMSTPKQKRNKNEIMPSPDLSIIQHLDEAIIEIEKSQNEYKKSATKKGDDITYFGFNSSSEENLPLNDNRNSLMKPLRVSLPSKKYIAKEAIEKRQQTFVDSSSDSDEVAEISETEKNADPNAPALFQDPIDNRKTTKRKQTVKPDLPAKRRKKDEMTKAEQEEFEKWAQSFNAMCKEVEQFPLDIE